LENWNNEKYQIPSTKLQTNLKFQYSMTKTGLEFRILVIVICLIFVICDLEFLDTPALQYPNKARSKKITEFCCSLLQFQIFMRDAQSVGG